MRRGLAIAPAVLASFALASVARAQLPPPPPPTTPQYEPPPPPSQSPPPRDRTPPRRERPEPAPARPAPRYYPPPPERYERPREEAPYARTGFQLALRTGVALPMGSATGGGGFAMSSLFKGQVPFLVDVGAKLSPSIFLGLYTGFGVGGAGNEFRDANGCAGSRSCSSSSFRIGVEVQYQFQPSDPMNPWVGYGLGYESATASSTGGGLTISETFGGFEFARLSGGLDFRLSRVFGIGPFGELSFGEYSSSDVKLSSGETSGSISNTSLHEWLTLGVRGVFFP